MRINEVKKGQQLNLFKKEESIQLSANRINIVSLKLVKESSILYKERVIRSPKRRIQTNETFPGRAGSGSLHSNQSRY